MNEEGLLKRRMEDWTRLETLCERAFANRANLSSDELTELVRLYRSASNDLALVRTRSANVPLANYLNNVVSRAYGVIYRAPRQGTFTALNNALTTAMYSVRKCKTYILASFIVFAGAILIAYIACISNPDMVRILAGPMAANIEDWKTSEGAERDLDESLGATFGYASNNPFVTIVAASVGLATFGIYSLKILFQNGMILGVLLEQMHSVGRLPFIISSLIPHGIPELSGIVIGGAAGIRMGWATVNPGLLPRSEAMKIAAADAVPLTLVGVALCFIAAPIEGFFSFNPSVPDSLKLTFGLLSAVFWVLFWNFFRKRETLEMAEKVETD